MLYRIFDVQVLLLSGSQNDCPFQIVVLIETSLVVVLGPDIGAHDGNLKYPTIISIIKSLRFKLLSECHLKILMMSTFDYYGLLRILMSKIEYCGLIDELRGVGKS